MAELMPCYVYVDGQYVREQLRAAGQSDEFDPGRPATVAHNYRVAGMQVTPTRVFYYDALDEQAPEEERNRQTAYFDRLRTMDDTHVVLGRVRRGAKRKEQKGVDVQLAVDALGAATAGAVKAIVLVTGDGDFEPLARAIREAGPHVFVFAFSNSLSSELEREADRVHKWAEPSTDWQLPPA